MVEALMYVALGALVASGLALLAMPLVHHRAVRLTMRRLEEALPVSLTEVQAEKDRLRAEHAVAARRLEIALGKAEARAADQIAETGRQAERARILKDELEAKTAVVATLSAEKADLVATLEARVAELAETRGQLESTLAETAEQAATIAELRAEISERDATIGGQRVEIAALQTRLDATEVARADIEQDLASARRALDEERGRLAAEMIPLAAADGPADAIRAEDAALREQIAETAAEVARLVAALEGPDSRVTALTAGQPAGSGTDLAARIRALQQRSTPS